MLNYFFRISLKSVLVAKTFLKSTAVASSSYWMGRQISKTLMGSFEMHGPGTVCSPHNDEREQCLHAMTDLTFFFMIKVSVCFGPNPHVC